MYNNRPDNSSFPPSRPGTFPASNMSSNFNNSIWTPSFNEQSTFAQSPYEQPQEAPEQQRQPDLQRFNRKQRGSLTSRLASLQILRQQVQQQGLPTRASNRGATQGNFISWYKSLNGDMKVALASISLLLFLLLSIGVFALAGGFQGAQSQTNPNTAPSNNSNAPVSTSTSTASSTATPTATATAQATPTATETTTQPTQQPIDVPQPTDTPQSQPTPTPQPTPTTEPTITPTPTPTTVPEATPTTAPANITNYSNPWGYDFNVGQRITSPPPNFCSYFTCATNFSAGTGYIVECKDGLYSLTGGTANACTGDGGFLQILYQHAN